MLHVSRTDLNLFVVFETIYTQGGVSKAAGFLNLSQPTISHALSRLRARTGDQLFVRQGRTLVPTPLARAMIGPVREALGTLDQTLGRLDAFDPAASDMSFTIGMRSLMESTYLLPVMMILNERAPGVAVSSTPYDRKQIGPQLASGDLNAVIDVFLPTDGTIHCEHLSTARSIVVARRNHPLIDGKITLKTYLAANHVCVTSRPGGQGPEDVALARLGERRSIVMRCQQVNTAMRILAMSDSILTMSETFAKRANIWFDHQIIATPFEVGPIDTYLYWHDSSETDPANLWFRNVIKAACQEDAGMGL